MPEKARPSLKAGKTQQQKLRVFSVISSSNVARTPPRGRPQLIIPVLALALFAACTSAEASAYRCIVDDKTSYQDHPCDGGKATAIQLAEPSRLDILSINAASRAKAEAALKQCRPGSDTCIKARAILAELDKLDKAVISEIDANLNRQLAITVNKTDAQINYRRARDAYDRAERAVD